jgi:N-acetylglucosamine-6-phosphate deacetylase
MAQPGGPEHFAIAAHRMFDGDAMCGPCVVEIADGRIFGVHGADGPLPDVALTRLADDAVLAPGFVDLQVNGGGGVLLNDAPNADGVARIAAAHLRFGTTSLLPTLITDSLETMQALLASARACLATRGVLGFHLEGPFINRERKGIHPARHIRAPAAADVEALLGFAAVGRSLVTLAPECVPPEMIEQLCAAGLRVAIGHSAASGAQALAAIGRGACCVTHLFNAMSQMTAREPGVVGVALAGEAVHAGIICDGIHVDPANVRAAWRAMGARRLFLVSDAMSSVGGSSDGFFLLERWISLRDGRLTDGDGTLAGAHLTMADAVAKATTLAGIPLEDALRMATSTPAACMGLGTEIGSIRPGLRADLVSYVDGGVSAVWQAGMRMPQV